MFWQNKLNALTISRFSDRSVLAVPSNVKTSRHCFNEGHGNGAHRIGKVINCQVWVKGMEKLSKIR